MTDELYALFGGKCYICGTNKNLTWHHRWYGTGKKYSDFPRTKQGKVDYAKEVEHQVRSNPVQFFLLCSKHHFITERMARWKRDKLHRLMEVVDLTETLPGIWIKEMLPNPQLEEAQKNARLL